MKPQTAKGGLRTGAHFVAAQMFIVVLQVSDLFQCPSFFFRFEGFHFGFEFVDPDGNAFELGNGIFGVVEQVEIHGMRIELLMQITDPCVLGDTDFALVGFDVMTDEAEDGGLAGPVGADDTNTLARIDAERHRLQHILRTELLAHLDKINHACSKGSTSYRTLGTVSSFEFGFLLLI